MSDTEDIEEQEEVKALTPELMMKGLGEPARTTENNSLALIRFECKGQEDDEEGDRIVDISLIGDYPLLRHVDLSENAIVDAAPLNKLQGLESLVIAKNATLEALTLTLPSLRTLDASDCGLTSLDLTGCPLLEYVKLNGNRINDISCLSGHKRLKVLEVRGNELRSVSGLCFPVLERLYMAANAVRTLVGLDAPRLAVIHARDNNMGADADPEEPEEPEDEDEAASPPTPAPPLLDAATLPKLRYLNLRGTKIAAVEELGVLGTLDLESVNVMDTGVGDRLEVIRELPRIVAVNKVRVTAEELDEALKVEEEEEEDE